MKKVDGSSGFGGSSELAPAQAQRHHPLSFSVVNNNNRMLVGGSPVLRELGTIRRILIIRRIRLDPSSWMLDGRVQKERAPIRRRALELL
ncbi:MAG: hypothetical protein ABIW94_10815 [Gemmatimonadaceae bacterium]